MTELTNENYFSKYRGVIELSSNDVRRSKQANTILVGIITKALLIQVSKRVREAIDNRRRLPLLD